MKLKIYELEIGPHFLTFYTSIEEFRLLLDVAPRCYNWIIKNMPEIAEIQQENFTHVVNDPNVYHPFGGPDNFRAAFKHFHIRYGRLPIAADIIALQPMIDAYLEFSEGFKITQLQQQKLPELEYLKYPEIKEPYLEWIEELRTGEWINTYVEKNNKT